MLTVFLINVLITNSMILEQVAQSPRYATMQPNVEKGLTDSLMIKIKYYLEGNGDDMQAVAALLDKVITELGDVWLEAGKHNLGYP
jgi:uncharacterized protein YoxC